MKASLPNLALVALLVATLLPQVAEAKRTPAPKPEPVVLEGIRYAAPNDDGRKAIVRATDVQSGKQLWEVTIFRNTINPLVEEDVQWVFIKELRLEDGKLTVLDERNRRYALYLKTRQVRRLPPLPSKKETSRSSQPSRLAGRSATDWPAS